MVCRRSAYDTKCYEPTECVFDPRGNVVQSLSTGYQSRQSKSSATPLARQVVDAMDYIGILAVEMFLEKGTGKIMVNEVAPVTHQPGIIRSSSARRPSSGNCCGLSWICRSGPSNIRDQGSMYGGSSSASPTVAKDRNRWPTLSAGKPWAIPASTPTSTASRHTRPSGRWAMERWWRACSASTETLPGRQCSRSLVACKAAPERFAGCRRDLHHRSHDAERVALQAGTFHFF